jgi:hypothetical protein
MYKAKRCCANCVKGIALTLNTDILCREKGVVSPDFECSSHRYAPIVKDSSNAPKCLECRFFNTKSPDSSIGVCKIFSVRQTDGSAKKACSKFEKKNIKNVV